MAIRVKIVTTRKTHSCALNNYLPDSTCFDEIRGKSRAVRIASNITLAMRGGGDETAWVSDYLHLRCYDYLTKHRKWSAIQELVGFNQATDEVGGDPQKTLF